MTELTDFCGQYRPGEGGSCIDCGRTFEEHCAQFGFRVEKAGNVVIRIEDNEKLHKPWCDCIAKLGDHKCNCLEARQKDALMLGHITGKKVKDCLRWRRSSSDNCICGLPWFMHSVEARNGYTLLKDYQPGIPASQPTMTNEEAAHWIISMGVDNASRLVKIQDLLRNAMKDGMTNEDRIFLEQVEKVLIHSAPDTPSKRGGKSLHPCAQCGQKVNDLAGRICADCAELAVEEADALDKKDIQRIIDVEDEKMIRFD